MEPLRSTDSTLDFSHAPATSLHTSISIAGYELLDEIGRGGMGVIYRARDLALDREVAIKLLLDRYAPDSGTARRFLDEARITGQLQHPGIPAVYQVGRLADGRPYLAMKLIKGQTLESLLKTPTKIDTLATFEAVSQAVGYAHAHGVIHRDLKTANIMVGSFGEVQVMDWGLAKVLANGGRRSPVPSSDPDETTAATLIKIDSDGSLTQAGSILGTPAFMAPEQAAGEIDKFDARLDVFGLGAILCVLLTGQPPFEGRDAESVRLNAVRGKTENAFARLDAGESDPDVVALCKRCLAFEPADRPSSANDVAAAVAALRRAADDRARKAERNQHAAEVRAAEQTKRRRSLFWATGVVMAVLLLGLGGTLFGLWMANAERNVAKAAVRSIDQKRQEAEAARQAEAAERQKAVAAAAGEKLAKEQAVAKEAETTAMIAFIEEKIFGALRPKGFFDIDYKNVTLRNAILACLPSLTDTFMNQPLVEARLRVSLGHSLTMMGDNRLAAEQFERSRAIYILRRGPDHPDALTSTSNLSMRIMDDGRYADALKFMQDTLARQRRILIADHMEITASLLLVIRCLKELDRVAEAIPLIDEFVSRVGPEPSLFAIPSLKGIERYTKAYAYRRDMPDMMFIRLKYFQKTADAAGCRTTAEMWEKLNHTDADGLYNAACLRAVTSAVQATSPGPDSVRMSLIESDRAMAWLNKALAGGYKDRTHMETDPDLDALRGRADFQQLTAIRRETTIPPRDKK